MNYSAKSVNVSGKGTFVIEGRGTYIFRWCHNILPSSELELPLLTLHQFEIPPSHLDGQSNLLPSCLGPSELAPQISVLVRQGHLS